MSKSVTNFNMLFLMIGFISLVDEIQFMQFMQLAAAISA